AGTLELNTILWGNKSSSGVVLTKTFVLDVADGATFVLNKITGSATLSNETYAGLGEVEGSSWLKIKNFDEKKIFVIDAGTESEQLAFLNRVALDGMDKENLHFQYDATAGGYWLSNIAVPEPAEWAMIFGGIALALAIYRRRK
ncbi:MAG: PEP-CTERM sorting domain-containing protein, partial [Opitutales bacterium]|nr:PEP-CTERM sorting domain-containing protein [Opitutales bacterium]